MKWFIGFLIYVRSECPEGWSKYLTNSKCYKAFESGKETSWTLAESVCQSNGADLVSFENEGEKNYVYEKDAVFRRYFLYGELHIILKPGNVKICEHWIFSII